VDYREKIKTKNEELKVSQPYFQRALKNPVFKAFCFLKLSEGEQTTADYVKGIENIFNFL
jgi:hypothetical protein